MTVDTAHLAVESPYIWRARRAGRRQRLICFPHAGASAGIFADWVDLLPPEIEPAAVQLPGRMNRIAEPPVTELASLLKVLPVALRPILDGPFAFYGHSGGAILAFELARVLRAAGGPQPGHLFLSGLAAPAFRQRLPHLHLLPDKELAAEVVALGGIEREIAEDAYMMGALMPLLRADFTLFERHTMASGPPLSVPITVLAGDADPRVPAEAVDAWRAETDAQFRVRRFPGGHFFFLGRAAELTGFISQTMLAPTTAGGTP